MEFIRGIHGFLKINDAMRDDMARILINHSEKGMMEFLNTSIEAFLKVILFTIYWNFFYPFTCKLQIKTCI